MEKTYIKRFTIFDDNSNTTDQTTYYKDGRRKKSYSYTNGVLNGNVRKFDKNGEILKDSVYNNGNKEVTHIYKDNQVIEKRQESACIIN